MKKIPGIVWKVFNAFLLAISPMMILMVVVCVIVLLDRGGAHYRAVQAFAQSNLTASGRIIDNDPAYDWALVEYMDETGETVTGFLDRAYYPELVNPLKAGDRVWVRYLPPGNEDDLILDAEFERVKNYWGYAFDVGIVLLISILVVIVHPECLYLGFTEQADQIWKLKQ